MVQAVVMISAANTLFIISIGLSLNDLIVYGAKIHKNICNTTWLYVIFNVKCITKLQKSIGYASTMIKESELKSVPVTNVAEAMAGKVASVSIN